MTQAELEAGADAVEKIAESHGVASWLSRDNLREIAAAVIKVIDEMRAPKVG